jgi:hypothetical protein
MLDGVAESWLEVAIERPTGAAEGAAVDADAVDETDEPRTVTLTGFGPRWVPPAGSSSTDPA